MILPQFLQSHYILSDICVLLKLISRLTETDVLIIILTLGEDRVNVPKTEKSALNATPYHLKKD